MRAAERILASEDAYIEAERMSLTKHELIDGAMVAMAGASPRHNAIVANLVAALVQRLRGRRCRAFPSDQRVHVEATELYTYPDVTVACGELRFHGRYPDTLLNPKVLFEVLSARTEGYDRGDKFVHYQSIPSLEEYVLVGQYQSRVEHFRRLDTGQWLLTVHQGDAAVLELPALGCAIPLAEIYENLDQLDVPPSESGPRSAPI